MKPVDERLLSLDPSSPDGWTLTANRCQDCQAEFHPRRARCPRCSGPDLEETSLLKTGKLVSYTKVHQTTAASLVPAPYYVGLVQIDRGPVIEAIGASALADSTLTVGARVRLTLESAAGGDGSEEVVFYGFLLDEEKEMRRE